MYLNKIFEDPGMYKDLEDSGTVSSRILTEILNKIFMKVFERVLPGIKLIKQ